MNNKEIKAPEYDMSSEKYGEENEKTITASEELKMYALEIIVDMLNNVAENIEACSYEYVEACARATKCLAEAIAAIVKADNEANIYDVIKGMYGTGIKGGAK